MPNNVTRIFKKSVFIIPENGIPQLATESPISLTIPKGSSNSNVLEFIPEKNTHIVVSLLPVELMKPKLDAQGNDTGEYEAVSEVEISRMEKSLTDTDQNKKLDIDKDVNRLFFRIKGGGDLDPGSIKISTVENEDSRWDDPETELELKKDGGDLVTETFILVADNFDDDEPVDNIADDQKGDRTHKISPGGKLKLSSLKLGQNAHQFEAKYPVPIRKEFSIAVSIYKPSGTAVVGDPIVTSALTFAKQTLAQGGFKLTWGDFSYFDKPANMDPRICSRFQRKQQHSFE